MVHSSINIPILSPCFVPFSFSFVAMLRLNILHPPRGVSGIQCRHYTAREKIAILSQICHIKRDTSVSYWVAAELVSISHMLVVCCCTLREHFNNIDIKQPPRYSGHHGPCGHFEDVKEALLAWIFERREMGFAILTYSVIIKASPCCLSWSRNPLLGNGW
jgi:hypothetical protein